MGLFVKKYMATLRHHLPAAVCRTANPNNLELWSISRYVSTLSLVAIASEVRTFIDESIAADLAISL